MTLLLSLVLAVVPLLGIAWTVASGSLDTVGGLFMTLIMLALSGILFLNVYLDLRHRLKEKQKAPAAQKTS
jgi:hypothetical protein